MLGVAGYVAVVCLLVECSPSARADSAALERACGRQARGRLAMCRGLFLARRPADDDDDALRARAGGGSGLENCPLRDIHIYVHAFAR